MNVLTTNLTVVLLCFNLSAAAIDAKLDNKSESVQKRRQLRHRPEQKTETHLDLLRSQSLLKLEPAACSLTSLL